MTDLEKRLEALLTPNADGLLPWRPVVTPDGERLDQYRINEIGEVQSCYKKAWVRRIQSKDKDGYLVISLVCPSAGKQRRFRVHSLVAATFIGPKPDGCVVRHLDGNPQNNNVSNIRYGTQKENENDKRLHGSHLFGERAPAAKLTENEVRQIRSMHSAGTPKMELSKLFGVTRRSISYIVNKRHWRHVSDAVGAP